MKAQFDDRVIAVRAISLPDGQRIPSGTHGFVIEAYDSPEAYEVEFDLGDQQVLARVSPDDFGVG